MSEAASMSQHWALRGAKRDGMFRRPTGYARTAASVLRRSVRLLPFRKDPQALGSLIFCATIRTTNDNETRRKQMNSKASLKTLLAASVMGVGLSHGALAQDTVK